MCKEDVALIAVQLLDVLSAAHAKGILHRDVKPENVFLTRTGAVKVLDFGIARLREGGEHDSVTTAGQMVGTPAFMAPEQALGRDDLGPPADVWAVGATMFALLTAHFVHEARTNSELLVFTATRPPRPISSVDATVAPELAAVIDRALSFDPAKRWPDARAMQRALRDLLREWCPGGHRLPASPSVTEALALEDTQTSSRRNIDAALAAPRVPRDVEPVSSEASGAAFAPTISSGQLPAASTTTGGVASSRGLARAPIAAPALRPRLVLALAVAAAVSLGGLATAALFWPGGSPAARAAPTAGATPAELTVSTLAPAIAVVPPSTSAITAPPAPSAASPPSASPAHARPLVRAAAASPSASPPSLPSPTVAPAPRLVVTADPLDRQ